jgi:hypothetical protein
MLNSDINHVIVIILFTGPTWPVLVNFNEVLFVLAILGQINIFTSPSYANCSARLVLFGQIQTLDSGATCPFCFMFDFGLNSKMTELHHPLLCCLGTSHLLHPCPHGIIGFGRVEIG